MKRFITYIISLSITTLTVVSCAAGIQETGITPNTSGTSNVVTTNTDTNQTNYTSTKDYTAITPSTITTNTSNTNISNSTLTSTNSLSSVFLSTFDANWDSIFSAIISSSKKVASESKDGDNCSNGQCCGGGCSSQAQAQVTSANSTPTLQEQIDALKKEKEIKDRELEEEVQKGLAEINACKAEWRDYQFQQGGWWDEDRIERERSRFMATCLNRK